MIEVKLLQLKYSFMKEGNDGWMRCLGGGGGCSERERGNIVLVAGLCQHKRHFCAKKGVGRGGRQN